MAASVQGILVTEGVRGEGVSAERKSGFSVQDIPELYATRRPTMKKKDGDTPRATGKPGGRRGLTGIMRPLHRKADQGRKGVVPITAYSCRHLLD